MIWFNISPEIKKIVDKLSIFLVVVTVRRLATEGYENTSNFFLKLNIIEIFYAINLYIASYF